MAEPIGKKLSLREVEADSKVIAEYIHRELGPMVERLRIVLSAMALRLPSGTGSPEGVVQAAPASLYQRTDGAPGTLIYRKNSGTGSTGWAAIA